uniref:non-specific serine/threonine protein kinase n=1 Tax=Oryza barthii TaxID=65489 RepID=A0A0D3HN52_9ORYZ
MELDVSINKFGYPVEASHVPEYFGSMKNIRYLDVSETSILSGRVPPQLGNLSNLRHLNLGFMDTDMYSVDISWLTNLHQLKYLDMSSVNLSAVNDISITSCVDLQNLCELTTLLLDGGLSSGNITKLVEKLPRCYLSPLKYLSLQGNNMTGMSPNEISHLKSISFLNLKNNSISGPIASGESRIEIEDRLNLKIPELPRRLRKLDVSMNFLNKFYGALPVWIGDLVNLQYLQLSYNMFYGDIPNSITNLDSIRFLNLAGNNISGSSSTFDKININDTKTSHDINGATKSSWLLLVVIAACTGSLFLVSDALHEHHHGRPNIAGATCVPHERDALLAFKEGVVGDPAGRLASWRPREDCFRHWRGVRCSNLTGHVLKLHLHNTDGGEAAMSGKYSGQLASSGEHDSILRVLGLGGCSLTSANQSLPHLNLTNLEELDLSYNYLDSIESCWFWNLTSLKKLNLDAIGLHGLFPNVLGDMVSLQVLVLSSNEMTMKTTNLTTLCNLRILQLGESYSYGNISELIESLPQCAFSKLQELSLRGNQFTGILPNWLGQLTSLVILDLSMNNITGPLPGIFGKFTDLRDLNLAGDQLTGHLPSQISMLSNLTRLDLSNNILDGLITDEHFVGLKGLEYIDLSHNKLKIVEEAHFTNCLQMGPMFPAWLQWQVDLSYLDITSTGIVDKLPDWFSNSLSKVIYLDISNNQISGGLPTNWEIMSVEQLYLSSNQFTGEIPSLPRNIITLDISSNSLTGNLPSNLSETPMLDTLILFSNITTGRIPESICNLSLYALDLANNHFEGDLPECAELKHLQFLMLSNNSFSGKFPSFLQRCFFLSFLDLAWNEFSGTLPMWIGNFTWLQFLRLNNNMFHGHITGSITGLGYLSGEIPPSLSNLTYLSILDLSYNNLTGPIPSGGQLETLYTYNPLMYSGNNGLCGFPLQRSCPGNSTSKNGDLSKEKHGDQQIPELHSDDQMFFLFGCGVGFVVGSWVVFFSLLSVKTWSIAYFRLFDSVYDKVYVLVVVNWGSLTGMKAAS